MDAPNPYESPHQVDLTENDERFVRRYFPLLAGGLGSGLVLSAFFPFVGVPLTLVAAPAMVRATRIYWRNVRAARHPNWTDWFGIFLVSLAVAFPASFVGGIAFCCVCTGAGFVGFTAFANNFHHVNPRVFQIAMYLGLAAGLLASLMLLKRFNYFSQIEKDAARQATGANHEPTAEGRPDDPSSIST